MKLMSRGALDPRWTRHHTPVAADFMLATIKVIRKLPSTQSTQPVYDQNTGLWTTNAFETVVENVKARVQPFGIIGDMNVGQDPTGRRLMRVQIENTVTGIRIDDMVIVTECVDSPELTTFTMEVRNTASASNAWLTDLVCELDVKSNA